MSAVASAVLPWRQFICRACGYVYDEKDGDPDGGLPPGTRYEDIPDDWACPLCGVSKDDFDPYEAVAVERRVAGDAVAFAASARRRHGVVILGGGLAAWSTARALRARDPDLPITLVAADGADVYPKPALSLAFGHRKTVRDLVSASGREAAVASRVRLVANAFAVSIDAVRRRVRTTRGTIPYDALVLAVGARPVDLDAMPSALCWRINELGAWTGLQAVLARDPARVTVIGAGLVGCELADDLAHAGHAVTVLDPAARPLLAWASVAESARLIEGWERLGIQFVAQTTVVRMERRSIDGRSVVVIHRTDDLFHDADVVIAAVGLTVDPRLPRSAGVTMDSGIAVDGATYATSVPSIYATGDCVSIDGKPCRFIEPIAMQAEAIAAAILDQPHDPTPFRAPLVRLKTRSAPMTLTPR